MEDDGGGRTRDTACQKSLPGDLVPGGNISARLYRLRLRYTRTVPHGSRAVRRGQAGE